MSEKMSEVFEKYDMNINGTKRVRGSIVCYTDKGIRQIVKLLDSENKLAKEHTLKEELYKKGFSKIDRYIVNTDDELLTYDRYGTPYVVKEFYEGVECDLKNEEDIRKTVRNLAKFHSVGKEIDCFGNGDVLRTIKNIEKHNRELKRVRAYIKGVTNKQEYELSYISCFDEFYRVAEETRKIFLENGFDSSNRRMGICHGSYNYHNVVIDGDNIATINFNKFMVDNQLNDLYQFVRKLMEKSNYSVDLLKIAIEEYNKEIPFDIEDYEYIYLLFRYPEKFWKISNYYYNTKKTFISPKNLDKLNTIIKQSEIRNAFLEEYKSIYKLNI